MDPSFSIARLQSGAWHVQAPSSISTNQVVGSDMLQGADAIAEFLFGNKRYRRKVYYLVESNKLPVLRLSGICARRSTLEQFLKEQELKSVVVRPAGLT